MTVTVVVTVVGVVSGPLEGCRLENLPSVGVLTGRVVLWEELVC